ncbi:hypothetical protein [Chrysiogenes arsenatis]|uniref:hypothetical protein n=1 Tax=Chrysiogenes arsenatis TaxID=309797 RepID=UPI0004037E9F|nr:hypothetical protein [Chrysiogenes arsenatis]
MDKKLECLNIRMSDVQRKRLRDFRDRNSPELSESETVRLLVEVGMSEFERRGALAILAGMMEVHE